MMFNTGKFTCSKKFLPVFKRLIFVILALFLISGVFFFNSNAQQANAATYSFEPSSGNLIQGCTYNLQLMIDASGENSNAADLEVSYDPNEIEIIDSIPDIPGIQINGGNAYEVYFYNKVDPAIGKIQLAGGSFIGTLTSKKVYGIIEFKTKPGITAAQFTIFFNGAGATLDSNIADTVTSLDLLTGVTNGSYTFSSGSCVQDETPPSITFNNPKNGQVNVPLDSNIEIWITDDMSGVDLDTLVFIVNGVEYPVTSPRVTYSGDPLNYLFTIDPIDDFPADESSTIRVIVSDYAGNKSNKVIVFNLPEGICECLKCEDCSSIDSANSGTGDYCDPGVGPCTEKIVNYIDDPNLFNNTILEGSWLSRLINDLGLAGTMASLAGLPLILSLLLSLLPYLSLLYASGFLQDIWALIMGKKKKPWGIVTNAEDDKPIPFAIVTAAYVESNALIKRVLTDTEGRYALDVEAGSYLIEVRKSSFEKTQATIMINEGDKKYVRDFELYPVGAKVLDKPIDKEENEKEKMKIKSLWWERFRTRMKVIWKYLKVVLFIVGFISSILAVIIRTNLFN